MTNKILIGILVVVVLLGFGAMSKYNSLITMRNGVDTQWAQVNTVLQRRMDSIDQAVGSLKIANKNEQDAIQKITDARKIYTAASNSGDIPAQVSAVNNYNGALNGLLLSRGINGEAYPNLQTPALVGGLMGGTTIEGNENRISVERQRYNDMVNTYNTEIQTFPGNILAGMFGFTKKSLFELTDPNAANAPKIAPDLNF